MAKYHFMGQHADTVYKGDKAVPVGPQDTIELTDKEMDDPLNMDVKEHLVAHAEVVENAKETKKEVSK